MSLSTKVEELRRLVRLISDASEVVIGEWQAQAQAQESPSPSSTSPILDADPSLLPSPSLYEARRTILGACGMMSDIVAEPQQRLMEIASGYHISRAMHVAAEGKIAEILADADPEQGMPINEIALRAGVEPRKLTNILRALCSIHVFKEVTEFHFANSRTSQCLVGNDPLRCWLLTNGLEVYTASEGLLRVLFDPVRKDSYDIRETAFQEAHRTKATLWELLEEPETKPDGSVGQKRGLEIFSLAMFGGGRVHAPPLYVDYPWEGLGSGTVVDVGGGVGGMCLELAKRFSDLKFVLQDRPAVIDKAKAVWQRELPEAVEKHRITFMAHDFLSEQPVKGAEVYFMRNIIHDWPDAECCTIFSHLRDAMGQYSRILTADQVIHTTLGSKYLKHAPAPLPANYGYAHQLAHIRDMNMLTLFNAKERTPEDLDDLAQRVGLKMTKVWECRGMMSITELRRDADASAGADALLAHRL